MFTTFISSISEQFFPNLQFNLPLVGNVDFLPVVTALTIFILLNALFWLLRKIIIVRLSSLSEKTNTDIDDVVIQAVKGVRTWVYSIVSLYLALQVFTLSEGIDFVLTSLFLLALVWQLIEIATGFVDYFSKRLLSKDEDGDGEIDPGSATATDMVTLLARVALWILGGLFVLSNLGIEVTSLLAGLGIGGIAVAFALQGILSDLFASFSIYFDKPFRIGDFVVIGADSGTVEKIGIKSTRIRTLQGEELVISNAELTTARVQNFKKMEERRIVMQFGITYETPQELVAKVPQIVTGIYKEIEKAKLDRVHFTTFGDSALIYEVVYYVDSSDYADYLDVQQSFNLTLMARFTELGIEFAYPTQVIYTKST